MKSIFHDIIDKYILVYLDSILIYLKSGTLHEEHLG